MSCVHYIHSLGFANEFQLDDFLEKSLPDVLERTFDENGVKMVPMPKAEVEQEAAKEEIKAANGIDSKTPTVEEKKAATTQVQQAAKETSAPDKDEAITECNDPVECLEQLERTVWLNRTVVPAFDGIRMPAKSLTP